MHLAFLIIACIICPLPLLAEDIAKDTTITEVVVTGTRNSVPKSAVAADVTVISNETLNRNFRPSILPTLTEQVPGLFVTSRGIMGYGVNTGAGNISLRGVGGGAQLMVLIDGQPQYAGLMGHPIPDAYQTSMAEKVEVLRGPACVLYGSNAMAGVVNIITAKENQQGHQGHLRVGAGSYASLQTDVAYRMRKNKFSTVATGSFQRTKGHRKDAEFLQGTAFVKVGYDISSHWSANADAQLTHFNSSNPGPLTAPLIDNDSRITRGLTSISLTNRYARSNGALRGYYDWGHHHINDGYSPGGTPLDYRYLHNDHIGGISAYESFSFFKGNNLTVGVDWQHFGGKAWNRNNNGTEKTLADTTQNEIGAYIDIRQQATRWLTVNGGLRIDWHSHAGTELVPQLGVAFHPTRNDDLKVIAGKGFRNPTIRELYMFRSANPTLHPEKMMNYEVSYSHRLSSHGSIGANLFLIKGKNLISTIMQGGRPLNVNTGSFTNHGLELQADYRFNTHWSANGNFSYLHMEKPIVGAPQGKFYLGCQYRHKQFNVIAGLQHISGLYINDAKTDENFTLLNITASYRILPHLTLWAKGENLLAVRYETYSGFPMPKATIMAGVKIDFGNDR